MVGKRRELGNKILAPLFCADMRTEYLICVNREKQII
jgi:hypothetical protein